jgi:Xaa-Pro aminopeptidase
MPQLAPTSVLAARLDALRSDLARQGLDALVVTHAPNVYYLANFASSAAIAIVTREALHVLADSRYTTALDELLASDAGPPGARAVAVGGSGSYDEVLAAWLLEHARGWRVGFEADHVSVKRHAWLGAKLAGAAAPPAFEPCDGLVERRRATKDDHEVGLLRESARRLSRVAAAVLADLTGYEGRTELEIAADIDHRLRLAGFERSAFDTIVASGPNSALPHAHPTDRRVGRSDLLLLDFGGVYGGYCSDLTRTVALGPPSDEVHGLFAAVAAAQDAALAVVRPGVLASDVDAAARQVLVDRGLGAAFSHATGHGLGLEIHEAPRVGQARAEGPPAGALEPGMVITIEPGAYVPGVGGVRLEDDVLVTSAGSDRLTDVPRELFRR